jgi:hypothetical protein
VVLCCAFSAPEASAQAIEEGKRQVRVLRVATPPVLDGVLDEPAWQLADVADRFIQRDPQEGEPATEPTEVRILTDGSSLYLGVHCFDSDPSGIIARELRRDNVSNDDVFSLVLDAFHDHRNGVFLRVTPLGNQADALITDEAGVNYNWDERWEVESRIHDKGWSLEIRIPFKALRFNASAEDLVFGLDFSRVVRRKNEFSYWTNYRRSHRFYQMSQSGHLVGLGQTDGGLRLRVKPYLNTQAVNRGVGSPETEFRGKLGLEDVKVPITSGLTLDLTVNPDFAQTEVDDQIVNFDRVPVLFPEKREFFLEGAGVFEVPGLDSGVRPYHSRRVGLSDGRTVPIIAGAKLSGRIGSRYRLGLMTMQTEGFDGRPGENFSVLRLKRDILARSSLGLFATNRQDRGGDRSLMTGVDQNLVFFRHLTMNGLLARSFSSDGDGEEDGVLWGAGWDWTSSLISAGFDYISVDDAFRADVGFLQRTGVRKYRPHFLLSPRLSGGPIRQYSFGIDLDQFRRLQANRLETEVYEFLAPEIMFSDASLLRFSPARTTEVLDEPLRLAGGLLVPPGKYEWWSLPAYYELNPAWKFTGSLQYRYDRDYFGGGGQRQVWNLRPTIRFNANVSSEIGYARTRVRLPGGRPVTVHVMNSRFNVAFSRRWTTSTLAQYSTTRSLLGVNFRLRYNYRPGDDLYLVVNGFRAGPDGATELDRSVTVKFTRSFDF